MNEHIFPLTHNTSIFLVQTIISLSTLALMGYLLIDGRDPGQFLPVLTGLLGYWLPSPSTNINRHPPATNLIQSPQTTVTEGTNTWINPPQTSPIIPEIKIDKPGEEESPHSSLIPVDSQGITTAKKPDDTQAAA